MRLPRPRLIHFAYAYAFVSQLHFERGIFMLFLQHRGVSIASIATLQVVLMTAAVLADIPTGYLADRIGRIPVMVSGCLLLVGCAGGMLQASSFPEYCALFAAEGFAYALISGADQAFLFEAVADSGRDGYARSFSTYQAASTAGLAVAVLVGGVLATTSYAYAYGATILAMIAAAFLAGLLGVLRGRAPHAEPQPSNLTAAIQVNSRLVAAATVAGLANAVFLVTAGPLYVYSQHILSTEQYSLAQIGVLTAAVTAAETIAYVAVRALVGPGKFRLCAACALGTAALLVAAALAPGLGYPAAWALITALGTMPLLITTASVQAVIGDVRRGTILSTLSALDTVAAIIGNILFGVLLSHCSIEGSLLALAIPPAIGGIGFGIATVLQARLASAAQPC